MDFCCSSIIWAFVIIAITRILFYFINREILEKPSPNEVVIITGCDNGLGLTIADYSLDLGLHVLACCLDINSDGAKKLTSLNKDNKVEIIELDLTKEESIAQAATNIRNILQKRPELKLRAVVNNAGVMIFGELAWQTNRLIKKQIDVNLTGTILFTRSIISLIRQYQGRIITVTSHCGIQPMAGLSIYSSTKAALTAWSTSLRVEQKKCNVKVITLVPGSFPTQTGILSYTKEAGIEMKAALEESERKFYNNYFDRFFNYYGSVPIFTKSPPKEAAIDYLKNYKNALFSINPKSQYLKEPNWRYKYYHLAMRYSPIALRDYLILKFSQNPPWNGGM